VILFFVRVNQVLVRLWARVISLAVRCGVVGIPTTDRRSPITDSAAPVDVWPGECVWCFEAPLWVSKTSCHAP